MRELNIVSTRSGGPNPMKGDLRTGTYNTSHNDTFQGQTATKLDAIHPVSSCHKQPTEYSHLSIIDYDTT